jgi:hypothetical protein
MRTGPFIQEECKKAIDTMYIIGVIVTGNYYARLPIIYTYTVAISTAAAGDPLPVRREAFSSPQWVEEYRTR